MIKLIAETAWHHDGDFNYMKQLVSNICISKADIVKLHITLNRDEYINDDHPGYISGKNRLFSESQWEEIINIVQRSDKDLMLLLNDTKAIEFAKKFSPKIIEIHSVCLNVPRLHNSILKHFDKGTTLVIGVGGSTLEEIDAAINSFNDMNIILMFGFQNYPTRYKDINLNKIRKIQKMYAELSYGYADHSSWDESNNENITMLVASSDMSFVEKHVTISYGEQRCDYEAAISIEMLDSLSKKLMLLDKILGDGSIGLSGSEVNYSKYGPMKMAAIANKNINKGDVFDEKSFDFIRTGQESDLSQVDVIRYIGLVSQSNINQGQVVLRRHFKE